MSRAMRRIASRLLGAITGRRRDSELAEELENHVRLLTEDNLRRGLTGEEARRQAQLQFGGLESAKESYRDQRGLPAIESTVQDVRYALRWMQKNPGFVAVAVLSLAIGIGANTAIFSLIHSVLLKPLAYSDPERLFSARELSSSFPGPMAVNPVHAREWVLRCPSIEDVAVVGRNRADLASGGEPLSTPAADVTDNTLRLFGTRPILGRTFVAEEEQEGTDRVAMISEALWRTRFQGDRAMVGKSILIDGANYEVIGVVPDSFRLPSSSEITGRVDILRPLVLKPEERARLMGNYNYLAFVRLRPGASAEQAVAEMNVVQARFPKLASSTRQLSAMLIPVQQVITGRAQSGLWMLAAATGAVLLIVCLNLSNLLLSRNAARTRETAIRAALGASRGRQLRQVMTESMLLALFGGALGVLFAHWMVRAMVAAPMIGLPRLSEVRVDGNVLAFSVFVTLAAGLIFGTLPALRLTRSDPQEALRAGSHTVTEGRSGLRLREGLISLEVGLSAALLIVAGLLGASLTRLLSVDRGFDAAQVLTVDLGLQSSHYSEPETRERFLDRLLVKLDQIPGVQASGAVTELPTRGTTWNDPIYLEGSGETAKHPVDNRYASPGYFRAMSIPLVSGRYFDESDRGRGVAVLSQKAAKLLWPEDTNPVGRRFIGEDDEPKILVGIVAEVRADLQTIAPAMAYYPYWQRPPDGIAIVVRTSGDPLAATSALRAAVRSEDPQLPLREIRTMDEVVHNSVAQRRFQLMLMAVFAGSALLVASLGIYGVVSYAVARRRNEIGIRMALGAQQPQLLRMVLRQGMLPVVFGLVLGVGAALLLGRMIRGLLFGIEPADPLTILAVCCLLLVIGACACLLPARRAASMDAVSALRFE